jgi:hypothetical protein
VTAVLRLATWIGLNVAAADMVNVRLVLMAPLPNGAGLVLAFGVALVQTGAREIRAASAKSLAILLPPRDS